jgi:hypothetical protein
MMVPIIAIGVALGVAVVGLTTRPAQSDTALPDRPDQAEKARADVLGLTLAQWHVAALNARRLDPAATGYMTATALTARAPTGVVPIAPVAAFSDGRCVATWVTLPSGVSPSDTTYWAARHAKLGAAGSVAVTGTTMRPHYIRETVPVGAYTPPTLLSMALPTGLALPDKTPVMLSCL